MGHYPLLLVVAEEGNSEDERAPEAVPSLSGAHEQNGGLPAVCPAELW